MSLKEKINKLFPVKTFLSSSVTASDEKSNTLIKGENATFIFPKSKEYENSYQNLYKQLYDYLPKINHDRIKNIVKELLDRGLIYFGASVGDSTSPTRLMITTNNKLAGIILNIDLCRIDTSGDIFECKNPILCIYMIYYGYLRSIIIINKEDISKEYQLHELASGYIYVLLIKYFGKNVFLTEKQKAFLRCACIYIYYVYYLKLTHNSALSIINRHHHDIVNSELLDEFMFEMKSLSRFDNIKQLPNLIIDLKITNDTPNSITIGLLKTLKTNGYYSFIGHLDMFLSFIVISKYPVSVVFNVDGLNNNKICDTIEDIILKYSKNIPYALDVIPTK